jgi:dolichol-phosphate mannosyltransferase
VRSIVVIPTYNEAETINTIVSSTLAHDATLNILVVDDGSPDDTGAIVDRLAAADDRISVIHRQGKQGLGTAYVAGFQYALDRGYEANMEMDADGSHDPAYIPAMIDCLEECDLVVGSRYMRGGGTANWSLLRQSISRGGNLIARLALGIPITDTTSGFRAYRRSVLEAIDLRRVALEGYAFQVAMVYEAACLGFELRESPILFADRTLGKSKMSVGIVLETASYVAGTRIARGRRTAGAHHH